MENRLIDIKEVDRITGLGRSTIYKKIKTGEFLPGVVKFNRHRWWLYEVMQFMGGDVTVNIAAPPATKPPRVKLAKHRAQLKELSAGKPKSPLSILTFRKIRVSPAIHITNCKPRR